METIEPSNSQPSLVDQRQSELTAIVERENYIRNRINELEDLIPKLNSELHDLYLELKCSVPRKTSEAQRAFAEAQFQLNAEVD